MIVHIGHSKSWFEWKGLTEILTGLRNVWVYSEVTGYRKSIYDKFFRFNLGNRGFNGQC